MKCPKKNGFDFDWLTDDYAVYSNVHSQKQYIAVKLED